MSTITLTAMTPFDAAIAQKFSFTYTGVDSTDVCHKNTLTVFNSSTNAAVYTNTETSDNLYQTLPAGTLANGSSYYYTFSAFNSATATTATVTSSNSAVFKCLTTPTWT